MNRAFKGIWIPAEVWLNDGLSVMEKLFLVEIDSLDNDSGCFASNAHFAEFFDISKGYWMLMSSISKMSVALGGTLPLPLSP